nr:MAG TPA: hypothetical protein [Caudoviricetes sp.]
MKILKKRQKSVLHAEKHVGQGFRSVFSIFILSRSASKVKENIEKIRGESPLLNLDKEIKVGT